MRVLRRLVLIQLAAVAVIAAPVAARPPHAGSLDRTFGDNGRLVFNLPGERMRPSTILVQSDGKIVVAGYLTDSATEYPGWANGRAFAVRFLRDGSIDRTFGEGGVARIRLRLPVRITGLGIQPDGALLLAGTASDEPGRDLAAMLRLLPNGALDEAFGTEGLATVEAESVSPYFPSYVLGLTELGVLPDGRILAAGTKNAYEVHTPVEPFMVRLLPNGAPDPAFGKDGGAAAGPQFPAAMVAQPDGSLVVLGTVADYFGEDQFAAYRVPGHASLADTAGAYQWKRSLTGGAAMLEPNGDIVFTGSLQTTSLRADLAWVRIGPDLELRERGRARSPGPVGGGTFDRRGAFLTMTNGPWDSFTLLRFRGRRFHQDRSFGTVNGRAVVGMPYPNASIGMEMQGADKLIVAGYTRPTDQAADVPVTLYRLHARQDAAPPALRLTGLRSRACLDATRSVVVRARDESRFLVRVSIDGRRVKQTRRRRLAIALDPEKLDRGRHRMTVTGTDAAGNRSRRERTFRVCTF